MHAKEDTDISPNNRISQFKGIDSANFVRAAASLSIAKRRSSLFGGNFKYPDNFYCNQTLKNYL